MVPRPEDIKKLRIKAKLTQKDLAKRAGVSQSLIARIERGDVNPRLSTIRRIFEALQEALEEGENVSSIMHSPVIVVSVEDPVEKIVKIMEEKGISQVPVVDNNYKVVGTITESTILKQLAKNREGNIYFKKAKEIMEPPLPIVPENTRKTVIIPLLSEYPAVLVQSKGKLVGIVTKIDLIKSGLKK